MLTTKQQIFDHVYKALRNQGFEQSLNETEDCMYFSIDEQSRCAAGWLMDADVFQTAQYEHGRLEHKDLKDVLHDVKANGIQDLFRFDHTDDHLIDFVVKLQKAHDDSSSSIIMKSRLRRIAELHSLTVPE